ncbi:hypothetical protein KGQ33_02580 [Patescibacteria group bacterium]|nr:hypothetical protein [Patescibacteria group bacterium]
MTNKELSVFDLSKKNTQAPRPGFEPGTFSLQFSFRYRKGWTISYPLPAGRQAFWDSGI